MKFCKKCNAITKRRANGECSPCANARNAAWRIANPDKEKACCAAWSAANREKTRARMKAWRAANKDKVSAQNSSWAAANKDKKNACLVRWRLANPELTRLHKQNRRSREMAGGKLSKDIVSKLIRIQRGKCACGCKQHLGDDYHLDHIMPLALGGTNTDDNMQLLTATCNMQKGKKHPVDFMQERGFLI